MNTLSNSVQQMNLFMNTDTHFELDRAKPRRNKKIYKRERERERKRKEYTLRTSKLLGSDGVMVSMPDDSMTGTSLSLIWNTFS